MEKVIRILFFQLIVRPLVSFFIGIRITGQENISFKKQCIMAANHSSHLDTLVLMSLFPAKELNRIRPVAAADYFMKNPVIFKLSRLFFNILPIERAHISRANNPLESLSAALQRGENLIMFPEGTRGHCEELGRFHSGIAHLVEEMPQVPLIPIYLSNMFRALPKGEVLLVPFICEVHIGRPLFLKGSKEEKMDILKGEILKLKGAAQW